MRWWVIFIKGIREQIRDYWILVMIVVMAPLFITIYYLMEETGTSAYDILIVNQDQEVEWNGVRTQLGDSLIDYSKHIFLLSEPRLNYAPESSRARAIEKLKEGVADAAVVIPGNFSSSVLGFETEEPATAQLELIGDVTQIGYMISAIWTEEFISACVNEWAGIQPPVTFSETTLGFSGRRTGFELYVPGLLILSIIMIIFSAAAAIVREPETRTLERLKISRLTALEFLLGTSLVQIFVAVLSLALALITAVALGYRIIPGTLGFIFLISFLTTLSMISFSLLVAAMCRSIKEVAIIGTFPLFLLMFFTGAAFPLEGGKLFTIGEHQVMLNDILSPKFAVEALNKVLIRGLKPSDALPEAVALLFLTVLYFALGTWAFRRRHMRAL